MMIPSNISNDEKEQLLSSRGYQKHLSFLNDINNSSNGTGSELSSSSANMRPRIKKNRTSSSSVVSSSLIPRDSRRNKRIPSTNKNSPQWSDFLNSCSTGRNTSNPVVKVIMILFTAILVNILWVYCPITFVYKSDLINQNNLRHGGSYYYPPPPSSIYQPSPPLPQSSDGDPLLLQRDVTTGSGSSPNRMNIQHNYDTSSSSSSLLFDAEKIKEKPIFDYDTRVKDEHEEHILQKIQEEKSMLMPSFEKNVVDTNVEEYKENELPEDILQAETAQEVLSYQTIVNDPQQQQQPLSEENDVSNEVQNNEQQEVTIEEEMTKETTPIAIPKLDNFKNAWEPFRKNQDQPVFWSLSSSTLASSTIFNILTTCYRFVPTLEEDSIQYTPTSKLAFVRSNDIPAYQDPKSYLNCNLFTTQGIEQCKALGFSTSRIHADFLLTPNIHSLNSHLFYDSSVKGKLFAIFQHPVQATIDHYTLLKGSNHNDEELSKMTLEEYVNSIYFTGNVLTRTLANVEVATREHLNEAMRLVNQKFLVGLASNQTQSLERFEKYFGWKYMVNPSIQEQCRNTLLSSSSSSAPNDVITDIIAEKNSLDIELYNYIQALFMEQEQFVSSSSGGYREEGVSCSKCVPPTFPVGDSVVVPTVERVVGADVSFKAPIPTIPAFDGFKDVTDPMEETDQPTFWHIPKAGGSTVKDIMGTCYRFTQASEAGIVDGHDKDTKIAVVRPGGESPFINCDASTIHGLKRCKELGLAESNLADFIASPYVYELEEIFSPKARGRLFTVFRHPVDRAVSLFYYIQIADWEPTYSPELAKLTLKEFATSQYIENDWMVRTLTQSYSGELSDAHLVVAKHIIKRKFLVGLLSKKIETMERIEKFFGWHWRVHPENQEKCREKLLVGGSNSNEKNKQSKPVKGDGVYELIAAQNVYDIQLYEFIEKEFEMQGVLFEGIEDGFRNVGASCAKCVPPTFPTIVSA